MKQEVLQPSDVLIGLKLCLAGNTEKSFEQLEHETRISSSTLHRSVKRLHQAKLIRQDKAVNQKAFLDFIHYGVKYAFYVVPGGLTRGIPTAYAAPPLNGIMSEANEIPVWPDVEGSARGFAVSPLHGSAGFIARKDPDLYELLALVDAIRIGNARDQREATKCLQERIFRAEYASYK